MPLTVFQCFQYFIGSVFIKRSFSMQFQNCHLKRNLPSQSCEGRILFNYFLKGFSKYKSKSLFKEILVNIYYYYFSYLKDYLDRTDRRQLKQFLRHFKFCKQFMFSSQYLKKRVIGYMGIGLFYQLMLFLTYHTPNQFFVIQSYQ